jgi:DNA-binding MarR family transcriptional regulator
MPNKAEIIAVIRQWMEAFAMRSMQGMTRYVKAEGLSMQQFSLMMRLYYGGECEVNDIGRLFETSDAAASQLVERLVKAGLAERTEDPDDRRVRRIALAAKGRALIDRGIDERYRWVDALVGYLPAAQRAEVERTLALLGEAEKKLPPLEQIARGPGGATKRSKQC